MKTMEQTATIKAENITEVKVSDKKDIDADGFLDVWQRKITSRRLQK